MTPELLTAIAAIIAALSWPVTVLILVLAFRKVILSWLTLTSTIQQRSVKARAGDFEIELNAIENIQNVALQIAQEPDPKKRLALAKNIIKLESIIPEVTEADLDVLVEFNGSSIANSKLVSLWEIQTDHALLSAYVKLQELGLLYSQNFYEGECVLTLTNLGQTLLNGFEANIIKDGSIRDRDTN